MNILIIPIFLILMYVALLRPQQKRVRRQQQLVTSVGIGDEVVTAGGLIGRVVGLTDDRLRLEVADGVVIEILRLAVSRRLEPAAAGPDPDATGTDMAATDVTATDMAATDVAAIDDFGTGAAEPAHDERAADGADATDGPAHLPPDADSH